MEGFTRTGRLDNIGDIVLSLDQCNIHNGKKLLGSFCSRTRRLELGPNKQAHMTQVMSAVAVVGKDELGLKANDTDRTGYRSQDWPSACRMLSQKLLAGLRGMLRRNPVLKGTVRFLEMTREYVSIFQSKTMRYEERIKRAATTVTYLRLWRNWVSNTNGKDPKVHFITWEACEDVISSCHFCVLIIKVFAEQFSSMPVPWDRLGSDVCETFFSSLGSFNLNKRVYSAKDALLTTRSKMFMEFMFCTTGAH